MTKLEELNNETQRIIEIYINAKENFSYSYYLHKPDTDEELKYLEFDSHLKLIRHSLWRLSIIEIAKLFSDNKNTHRFNLHHFISKFKMGGYFSDIKIEERKIDEWKALILEEEDLIKNILLLRNKIYAHTDPNKDDYKSLEIYFIQIKKLFGIVEIIIKDLYLIAFDSDIDLRTPIFDRNEFDIVKILSKEHQNKIDKILSKMRR